MIVTVFVHSPCYASFLDSLAMPVKEVPIEVPDGSEILYSKAGRDYWLFVPSLTDPDLVCHALSAADLLEAVRRGDSRFRQLPQWHRQSWPRVAYSVCQGGV